jgi:hypothetical protein
LEVRGKTIGRPLAQDDATLGVLTHVEGVLAEVAQHGLDELLGAGLEARNALGVLLGQVLLDALHVALDEGDELLLVKTNVLQVVRVHNVDDLLGGRVIDVLTTNAIVLTALDDVLRAQGAKSRKAFTARSGTQ